MDRIAKESECDLLALPSSYSWNMDMTAGVLTDSFVCEVTLGIEAIYARGIRQKEIGFLPSCLNSPTLVTFGILEQERNRNHLT